MQQLESTVSVKIYIEDINDNAPIFSQSIYFMNLLENIKKGTLIALPIATDRDSSVNGVKKYRLAAETPHFFKLHEELDNETNTIIPYLKVEKPLNLPLGPYNLTLEALDGGDPTLIGSSVLTINIDDANDHAPQFKEEFKDYYVREDHNVTESFYRAEAFDDDSGVNAQITYSIIEDSHLSRMAKEMSPGYQLSTLITPDFESIRSYRIRIQCSDNNRPFLTSSVDIYARIVDENDNAPEFSHPQYSFEIDENTPENSTINMISASDRDDGENSRLKYSIMETKLSSSLVSIDENTGRLRTASVLDYEKIKEINFKVRVVDCGIPPREADASVRIKINDVNDEAPTFTASSYHFVVQENNQAGTEVGIVTAIDADSYPNNNFLYELMDEEEDRSKKPIFFSVNVRNGQILATATFDRESVSEYRFKVRAIDSGNAMLSGTTEVIVKISDANDNKPKIIDIKRPRFGHGTTDELVIDKQHENVDEENLLETIDVTSTTLSNQVPVGFEICTFVATDADEGDNDDDDVVVVLMMKTTTMMVMLVTLMTMTTKMMMIII
ncbi:hypothetical protein HELRODRAFT_72088 [Helobdella robusta]|uniref:Cadherin domain-containing protein n=1 Tax=Helobdella robusta TaxID=6412 RepID=T1G0V4_HELRO|nr:hypothetical protein HELRODRAFT_72088 [Helobdella robusta]ESO10692.1 hypothetical protein HELRODRAFT_72088 [Helobdella robusta]